MTLHARVEDRMRGGMSPHEATLVRQRDFVWLATSSLSYGTKGSTVAPIEGQPTYTVSQEWSCVGESWGWQWARMTKRRARRVKPQRGHILS